MKKTASFFFSVLVCSFWLSTFLSCEKDPEIVTNTIIQTDTVFINTSDTIFLSDTVNLTTFIQDTVTTFILVRHAEDEDVGPDPDLTMLGLERTEVLQNTLANVPLNAVFSTNFNRTMQTAGPVAADQSLAIENYNPFNLNSFVDQVLEQHWSEAVLVVGHSDTTPNLLNLLTGTSTYSHLPEFEFNNLYIVSVIEKGRAEVVHLKYGD